MGIDSLVFYHVTASANQTTFLLSRAAVSHFVFDYVIIDYKYTSRLVCVYGNQRGIQTVLNLEIDDRFCKMREIGISRYKILAV